MSDRDRESPRGPRGSVPLDAGNELGDGEHTARPQGHGLKPPHRVSPKTLQSPRPTGVGHGCNTSYARTHTETCGRHRSLAPQPLS